MKCYKCLNKFIVSSFNCSRRNTSWRGKRLYFVFMKFIPILNKEQIFWKLWRRGGSTNIWREIKKCSDIFIEMTITYKHQSF
ncbi:unnamed protein product [Blepharisma stoltei]|uniref:Uncharacterized protein n=1 Tax=Blepharisma stoltei TaxID=1481888 RepID=A0AAU9JHF4_9CILI|nr:unnamed protein product [Blepharisma stoltei]